MVNLLVKWAPMLDFTGSKIRLPARHWFRPPPPGIGSPARRPALVPPARLAFVAYLGLFALLCCIGCILFRLHFSFGLIFWLHVLFYGSRACSVYLPQFNRFGSVCNLVGMIG